MAKITGKQLVEAFQSYVKEGWGYVYGSQGQTYTQALAQSWQSAGRAVPSGRNKKTYFIDDCAKWYGHRVADCSGGIVYTIQQYDKTFGDRTANTFKSQFVESGPISTMPEIQGLGLWRSGHIGVYEGNGWLLEFRGTDYGCVRERLKDRNFTHWGKIKGVEYGEQAGPDVSKPYIEALGSVNVRGKPNATGKVLGVAKKGDKLPLADSGWHHVILNGKEGYISGQPNLTKRVD